MQTWQKRKMKSHKENLPDIPTEYRTADEWKKANTSEKSLTLWMKENYEVENTFKLEY